MNLYGDRGNIIALQKRGGWRGIQVKVEEVELGDRLSAGDFDLYFFGGGQDQSQDLVGHDLAKGNGKILKKEIERGIPLLAICGGYQLLGRHYQPKTGSRIKGVGLFDAYTISGDRRLVGNLVVRIEPSLEKEVGPPPTLVGFENHSGQTYLGPKVKPLGFVISGNGNNGKDKTEGAVYKNAIGCYLHGSLLPKNPHLADWLLTRALESSGQDPSLKKLDDELELTAHRHALEHARDLG